MSMPQLDLEQLFNKVKLQHAPVLEDVAYTVGSDGDAEGTEGTGTDLQIIPESVQIPAGPLRTLDYTRLASKSELMEQLNSDLPVNGFNLPIFYYRSDLLDHERLRALADPEIEQHVVDDLSNMLSVATQRLTYAEGYPLTPDGEPFWRQLPDEPPEAYTSFLRYMELEGARKLVDITSVNIVQLKSWFNIYMWDWRIKSYDMYLVAHHQRLRVQRAMTAEDKHFKTSAKIFDMLQAAIESPEFSEAIVQQSPATIVAMLEKLVRIQRVSVGLTADGRKDSEEAMRPPSISVIMEQISQAPNGSDVQKGDDFRNILEDADNLEAAQRLILKIGHGG